MIETRRERERERERETTMQTFAVVERASGETRCVCVCVVVRSGGRAVSADTVHESGREARQTDAGDGH